MGLRASDEERERTVALLRGQQALGRLTLEELEERSAAAWAAVEVTELQALMADLPRSEVARPVPPARKPPRVPGRIPFRARWRAAVRPAKAMAELIEHVAPALHGYGYVLHERTPDRALFVRRRTPGWVPFVCVLLFPVGLLALMVKTDERITVELVEQGGETLFIATGTAPLRVRRAFAVLEAD